MLDVDCDEGLIKTLLASVPGNFLIDALVDEVERRSRVKLLLPCLNAQIQAASKSLTSTVDRQDLHR